MTTHVETENALMQFIRESHELFASEPDPEQRWTAMAPILARLLADPAVVAASKHWPECTHRDGRAENLLFYEDPEYGFAINGLTKSNDPSRRSRGNIHDHAHIYTLYGVLDGHERVERYERTDDGSRPDYAVIERTVDVHVSPGEIDLVKPFEIHTEVAVGERTVALIIRSEKSGDFDQGHYDVQTHRYWESPGPLQVPCEMLPAQPAR